MNSLLEAQLFPICLLLLLASASLRAQVFHTNFNPDEASEYWINANPVIDSSAKTGNFVNRIEAQHTYAHGLQYAIPDSLYHNSLEITFSAWFRFARLPENAIYVISLVNEDGVRYWHGIRIDGFVDTTAKWTKVERNISIPANYLRDGILKAYVWNQSAEVFDMDEVTLSIQKYQIPSFMPELNIPEQTGRPIVMTQNHFYEVLYFPETGSLIIADNRGRHLTSPIGLFADFIGEHHHVTEAYDWKFVRKRQTSNDVRIKLRKRTIWGLVNLTIETSFYSPEIQFSIEEKLRKPSRWNRRSITIGLHNKVHKVMRKNSLEDNYFFQDEYYLDRQGIIAGSNSRSLTLYHLSGISSMQLNTNRNELLLNLDYANDHPFMHYPMLADTADVFMDLSAAKNKSGERFTHHFSLYAGNSIESLPRFMHIPLGYESAMVWTEHADWTDIRTQRAVNFGHEDIEEAANATGGFVKYGIPVTKSVFYNNPDQVTNNEASNGQFPGLHATVKSDTAFLDFLKQLQHHGHEICLHTPEQYTSTQTNLAEALQFMQQQFGSPTWIDHGYNNKPHNNRENLVCDGLLPHSPQYARDLWQSHGVKYFWNPYIEEVNPFIEWAFNGQLITPYPGFGDAFPDRIISRHPNFHEALLWSTSGTLEVQRDEFWGYIFHPDRLADLVQHRSIYINHVYPAWVREHKGFWHYNDDEKIVVQAGFNAALARIAGMRDERKMLPITIADLLTYNEAIQLIDYKIIEQGLVEITNRGVNRINGLSMAVSALGVKVNGRTPESKMSGQDLLFWFDLNPSEKAEIRYW